MAEQEYPSLNGVEPSWADIGLQFPIHKGAIWKPGPAFAAVNWSDTVEVGEAPGANGGRKWRRTTGSYGCEASVTLYRSGWQAFRQELKAKSRKLSLVGFDLIIQHTPPEETGDTGIYIVKILGCRITGRSLSHAEGTDADKIEIALNPMIVEELDPGETEGVSLL